MTTIATDAPQYAIVVNGTTPGVPVPADSSLIVVGPSPDHNMLRELLYKWFEQGERTGRPVPYHITKVGPAAGADLDRTPGNAVVYEREVWAQNRWTSVTWVGWTNDAGVAAHPYAMFYGQHPAGVTVEVFACLHHARKRPGFRRGAWVIEREDDGAELAVVASKREAVRLLRELTTEHYATAA